MPYKILHTVGNPASAEPWIEGDIIADKELLVPGVSIKRLTRLGAIEATDERPKLVGRPAANEDDEDYDDVIPVGGVTETESAAGADNNNDGVVDSWEALENAELRAALTDRGLPVAGNTPRVKMLADLRAWQPQE